MRTRRLLTAAAAVLVVLLVMTWYGRLARCQAELAAWAQIRAAVITKYSAVFLDEEARQDPQIVSLLDAAGVTRTETTVRRYCDAPIWEWWR